MQNIAIKYIAILDMQHNLATNSMIALLNSSTISETQMNIVSNEIRNDMIYLTNGILSLQT